MQLGIGSYSYRWAMGFKDVRPDRPMTPADLVRKARALDLDLVQLADNVGLHTADTAIVSELANTARTLNVEVELGLNGLRAETLEPYFKLAETLDARILRVAPDATDAERPTEEIVSSLRDALPRLEVGNIVLAIENHFHFPSPHLKTILDAVDHPRVGVCLDVANSIAIGEWPADTIAMLAPFAVNLHLKDYVIAIDPYGVGMAVTGTPLGKGFLDIASVFDALEREGRDVNVLLEHWLPRAESHSQTTANEDEWLEQSITAARPFITAFQNTRNGG
ncbi:sugar phosphate isomerase/epimerase family protein [Pelagibacterium luteolum]|uniref:Sugar phosphate isomerase/epimerase n=1 Tax=Pelagibacterium luteolum TaxID=440168 RepID=A0A1G7YEC6_9HYPH|nr:sugar phosphate isomerase/epimerase family protein [Pelagibacterium luteolum]SDG94717.1 Sugar phosphate isomerase/epimerase [Pelagibacterium luteolum]